MSTSFKVWLHSLAAAAIGGASTTLGSTLIAPQDFNFTGHGFTNLWHIAIAGAVIPVLALLKQSPVPPISQDSSATNATTKAIALVLCCLLLTSGMTGCTVSTAQIAADGKAIGQALTAVAAIEKVGNPQLASQLTLISSNIETITSNWQAGSSEALFNDAAMAAETVLAEVPATEAVAPLIPIAVAAIDFLINPSATPTTPTALSAHSMSARTAIAPNPYKGFKIQHMMMRSPEGDFKAAWDSVVKSHPGLSAAILK